MNILIGKRIFTCLLYVLTPVSMVFSQGNSLLENIKFQQLSQGLSQNTVTCILQDEQGFMWFGTRNGLNKYDGVTFKVYENIHNDSTSISDSHINYIFQDSQHRLWVGTWEGGLNLFDRDREIFIHFIHDPNDPNSISDNSVYVIYEDSNNDLWIGTENGGLNRFDEKTGVFEHFKHDPKDHKSLANNHVRVIFEDKENNLWIGTYGGGIDRLDRMNKRFIHHRHDEDDPSSISDDMVWKYIQDSGDNIWLGTKGGLNLLDISNGIPEFKSFKHDINNENSLGHNTVMSMSEDGFGRLWIGTENGGLSVFDYRQNEFTNFFPDPLDPASIGSNSIWSIYKDNTGTMWVGARNRGLNKWDKYQRKFNHRIISPSGDNRLSNKDVNCFLEDREGNLWIGTDGGGLNCYDQESQEYIHYINDPSDPTSLGSNSVTSLLEDYQGNIWVGTWEGGLNMFDKATKKFKRFVNNPKDPGSLGTNNVFTILEDHDHRLWVGVFYGGIDLYDPERDKFIHFPHDPLNANSVGHNRVFTLYEDSNQAIWIGTLGGGISQMRFDEKKGPQFRHFKHDPDDGTSISSNGIHAIYEDSHHNLWIATLDGLNKFNRATQSFDVLGKLDGLPNNVIHGMLEDDNGFLWISTNQGLSKYDPVKNEFRNYNLADGLQAQEFIRGSYMKSSSGELYFGGVNGFNSFHPINVKDNPYIPPIYITGFKIYNETVRPGDKNSPLTKHISETDEIELSYSQNEFSFEFAALNYSQASKNRYAYFLEGYDRSWHFVGTQRNANYARVPHGTYTFIVRGTNNDGLWNDEGATLKIIITPPWWNTWWAYTGYASILIALFLWYHQNLINRERLKSDLMLEHMELTKMQELDELKSNFFANISHEFRTPLTLILSPLKSLLNGNFKGDVLRQYQLMTRNAERLLRLINQLLDLSKLESGKMKLKASRQNIVQFLKPIVASFDSYAERRKVSYNFQFTQDPIFVYFDPDKLEKIITNLISNAFKFTNQGEISIMLDVGEVVDDSIFDDPKIKEFVRIQVKDTGLGIPNESLGLVFERFYQVKRTHHHEKEGTGIGLSLTKDLVNLHQGKISVTSLEGEGTIFQLLLPLGRTHLDKSEIVDQVDERNWEMQDVLAELNEFRESDDPNQPTEKGKKQDGMPVVLVVEDNRDMRAYICETLVTEYNLIEAVDGQDGLKQALETLPDLIISDVMMPEMDGVTMCDIIKSDERICHIPIILLTAKTELEHKIKGLETGADDYITKPFESRLLAVRVKNLIHTRQLLRDRFSRNNGFSIEPKDIAVTSLDEKLIENILEIIEKNMANSDFRVEDLSKEIAMSRMHLYRKIKALTGQSIVEFVRTIRLKRAAQLLKHGHLTVSEVTYDVGFNDLQYFRNCFKKHFGMSPSEYANKVTVDDS